MNKKGWVTRDYVVAALFFSAIIALAFLMIQAQGVEYNKPEIIDESFNSSFNKFDDTTNTIKESFDSVNQEGGLTPKGTFDLFFESTFTVIRLIFGSLVVMGQQVAAFGTFFGIDTRVTSIILGLLISGLTAIIIFIVISSISRGRL